MIMPPAMDLLERIDESESLALAWKAVGTGGAMVLVAGEAGIGKTSLLEAFAADLPRSARTAWGRCESLGVPRPLAPVLEIAAGLLSGGSSLLAGAQAPQDRFPELLQAFRRAGPAFIVIEDAHWADQATLDFIRYAGRRIEQLRSLVAVTFRSDELGGSHPLREVLGALATSRSLVRIDLRPLSVEAVRRMTSGVISDPELLHARTGGNPFFVREAAREAEAAVPRAVGDLIAGRLAGLRPTARDLVDVLAISGRADPQLLNRLSATAAADVEAAVAAGLVHSRGDDVVFRHELTRDAVLQAIGRPRAVEGHRRVLRALQDLGETDAARLAHHALGAGDAEAIRANAPVAARHAMAFGAPREAWALLDKALPHFDGERLHERAQLLMEFARASVATGRLEQAIEVLSEALAAWRSLGDVRQQGVCLRSVAIPLVRAGRNAAADQSARAAIEVLEPLGDSAELAAALRVQAHVRMLDRDKALALHYGRRAIRMSRSLGVAATLAEAHMTVGTTLLVADDLEGRSHVERAQQMARASNSYELLALTYSNAGSASAEQFRFDQAQSYLAEGLAIATSRDLDGEAHYMRAWLSLIDVYRGSLTAAVESSRRLLATGGLSAITRIMALVALGRGLVRLGESGAGSALDEALGLAAETGTLQRLAPVRLARAEAAWLDGDLARARAEADAVWSLAIGHRHQWHGGEAAYWRALGGAGEEPPKWIAQPYALELLGRSGAAAQAWAALGCPYEQARALARGDLDARRTAVQIFDSIGAAPAAAALRRDLRRGGVKQVPRGPRPATRKSPWGLTPREQQIADLLGGGLTNELISRRLRISPKTVETHVSAILAKLSVATRTEARALLAIHAARAEKSA
jgi:DNA-binding CsgD family transcriptional regulator/tetratricopeptide (TPR) repeat protein